MKIIETFVRRVPSLEDGRLRVSVDTDVWENIDDSNTHGKFCVDRFGGQINADSADTGYQLRCVDAIRYEDEDIFVAFLAVPESYGPNYRLADGAANSYRWSATSPVGRDLQPGSYEVYAWWVSGSSYASAVDYTIVHSGGTANVTQSHQGRGSRWRLLGTWDFDDSNNNYVEVSAAAGKFTADAIRFVTVPGPGTISTNSYFVHSDHLGTPRAVSDSNQTTVWRWYSTPFGDSVPDEDPDGDGNSLTLNLRFPGQYYDQESGLFYNYFRDYDASTGRYIESDPVGLNGGLNTFGYVVQNPLGLSDPLGLDPGDLFATRDDAAIDAGNYARTYSSNREYGGWVYPLDSCWTYNFIIDKARSLDDGALLEIRQGNDIWHTHPSNYGSYVDQEHFSGRPLEVGPKGKIGTGDRGTSARENLGIYLNTPRGTNRYYNFQAGENRVLENREPKRCDPCESK